MSATKFACESLEEMRNILKHVNEDTWQRSLRIMNMLVEELQFAFSNMEGAISLHHAVERLEEKRKELKAEIKELKAEKLSIKPGAKDDDSEFNYRMRSF